MPKRCFVIAPIGQENSEIRKRSDQIFSYVIKPTVERFGYEAKGLWKFMLTYHPELPTNHISKDIRIPTYNIDGLLVRVIIHRTDTVSVLVACPLAPIAADVIGVICLSNAFARVEERLATLLTSSVTAIAAGVGYNCPIRIPNHNAWVVIMCHCHLRCHRYLYYSLKSNCRIL
jgi:hypothetical protein